MTILDTNALIRFFTNDFPEKAIKVKKLIEEEKAIVAPDVVLAETEYVLTGKVYKLKREDVKKAFSFLGSCRSIKLSKEAREAIRIYNETSLDIADCLLVAHAKIRNCKLAGFDKKLLDTTGVGGYWKI